MRFLLDTHVFLWTILELKRLPNSVIKAIQDPRNEVFVSAISFWEISIKSRLGKIDLIDFTSSDLIPSATAMGFLTIGLASDEAVSQDRLKENTHFDPFDRMLIWQAIQRDLVVVSGDPEFEKFKPDGLELLWK